MATNQKNKKEVKRCVEMFTDEVSIVTRGANGHKEFLMVKADEEGELGAVVEEDVEKQVPDKSANRDQKVKAQASRATKYGIEILPKGSNLSYPAGDPTTEALFGDPVNLKYPLAYAGATKPDPGRTRNAIARFKQNSSAYSKNASKQRVYERIVRAALSAGIKVSFDAKDPVDALLPSDLKTRLQKEAADGPDTEPESTESNTADAAEVSVADWLAGIKKSVSEEPETDWLADAKAILDSVDGSQEQQGLQKNDNDDVPAADEEPGDEPETIPTQDPRPQAEALDKVDDDAVKQAMESLQKASQAKDAQIVAMQKSITELTARLGRLSTPIGASHSMRPGESATEPKKKDPYEDRNASLDLSPPLK